MLRGIFDGGGLRKQNGHWQSSGAGITPPVPAAVDFGEVIVTLPRLIFSSGQYYFDDNINYAVKVQAVKTLDVPYATPQLLQKFKATISPIITESNNAGQILCYTRKTFSYSDGFHITQIAPFPPFGPVPSAGMIPYDSENHEFTFPDFPYDTVFELSNVPVKGALLTDSPQVECALGTYLSNAISVTKLGFYFTVSIKRDSVIQLIQNTDLQIKVHLEGVLN